MKKTKKRNNFLEKYFSDLSKTIEPDTQSLKKLYLVKDYFISTSRKKGKILIFGNGGSSAIASHVSVDFLNESEQESTDDRKSSERHSQQQDEDDESGDWFEPTDIKKKDQL